MQTFSITNRNYKMGDAKRQDPTAPPDADEIDERTGLKKKPPSGYLEGVMNHIKCTVGSGIFALGFGMKNAGMALGPPILIALGLMQLHCQHMLLEAGKEVEKSLGRKPDFAETGKGVFEYGPEKVKKMQKSMKIFSNFMLTLTQTGVLTIYIVFFADSMMRVADYLDFKDFSIQIWVLVAFAPIVATSSTLGNLMLVGYLSLVANCLILIGILITIYLTTTDMPDEVKFEWIGDLTQLPMFFSISILSFTAIQVVLPTYIESKKPELVGSLFGVLNVATTCEILVTLVVAILSYRKYGSECKGSVTLNFEPSVTAHIVVIVVGLAVMLSYTLNVYVVIEALFPLASEKWGPFRFPRIAVFLFRLAYIILTFILAWTLPLLGQIVALVGAFGNTSISVILPTFFHLIIMWERSSVIIKVKDFFILFLGIFSLMAGIVSAVMDIVKEIDKVYNPTEAPTGASPTM